MQTLEQKKVFNWAKAQLGSTENVDSITEFTKGEVLARIIGRIAQRRVDKIISHPKLRIEQVQNLNVALAFAKNELQLRNLNLNAEAFMDPSPMVSSKAAWSLLTMLYKKYADPLCEEHEAPLLEWARTLSGLEIPSLKSMRHGLAFLAIISKLSEATNSPKLSSNVTETSNNDAATNQDNEVITLDFVSPPPSDPVELALSLSHQHFGIASPVPAQDIASGNVSAILSLLTLLHNVATMQLRQNQYEEDNCKNTTLIQTLKEENACLEQENLEALYEARVLNEQVITDTLDQIRLGLKVEVAELQFATSSLASKNNELRQYMINREKDEITSSMECKFQLECHANYLRNYLNLVGDSAAVADIQTTLMEIQHSLVGTESEQLAEIYHLIDAETERIDSLKGLLHEKALRERAKEEQLRKERMEMCGIRDAKEERGVDGEAEGEAERTENDEVDGAEEEEEEEKAGELYWMSSSMITC